MVRAPEIDRAGLQWLNVPKPLSLADLRGRLVILDFWTFCCINCIHVLPSLRRVEEAFPEEVAVIGVHSPKFPAEKDLRNVAAAVERYGIRHPVVHDPDFTLWTEYAVRAWPTLVFIGPDGRVLSQTSGEPDPDILLAAVSKAVAGIRAEGLLLPRRLPSTPIRAATGRLRFPGKIKPARLKGERVWAVADAGHHQIVLITENGRELRRFGSGDAGLADGPAETARFASPQGLTASDDALYVADTGNHAIRKIDPVTGAVSTLAGTGRRGGALGAPDSGPDTALASPWDLEVRDDLLFFANAGTHQIGQFDLRSGRVARLAGAGPEGIRDGIAGKAHFAQPSGLALSTDGSVLWVADSETSAIRSVDLDTGHVSTLIGSGLFDFGHANGPIEDAELQHCLGIAAEDGVLWVADSYNGAVRRLDLQRRVAEDADEGFVCEDPVCLPLSEPAGIWSAGSGRLLVADTNNHRIVEIDTIRRRTRTWFGQEEPERFTRS